MIDVVNLKEMPQGIMEIGGRIEILSRKNMLSGILPEPFNNIELGEYGGRNMRSIPRSAAILKK